MKLYTEQDLLDIKEIDDAMKLVEEADKNLNEVMVRIFKKLKEEKFHRENRYLVFKFNDLDQAITSEEWEQLDLISDKVDNYRDDVGKIPLECVVVESDWPEYEPTWQMIEKRVKEERG